MYANHKCGIFQIPRYAIECNRWNSIVFIFIAEGNEFEYVLSEVANQYARGSVHSGCIAKNIDAQSGNHSYNHQHRHRRTKWHAQ